MDFRAWLERTEFNDPIVDAILKVTAQDQSLSDESKEHELSRNTNEFSNDIQDQIKELGIVQQAQVPDIDTLIEKGITLRDLVEKLKGNDYAPMADTQPVVDPTVNSQPNQQMYIQP